MIKGIKRFFCYDSYDITYVFYDTMDGLLDVMAAFDNTKLHISLSLTPSDGTYRSRA